MEKGEILSAEAIETPTPTPTITQSPSVSEDRDDSSKTSEAIVITDKDSGAQAIFEEDGDDNLPVYEGVVYDDSNGEVNENYAGIVEDSRVSLVNQAIGYEDDNAADEINNVKAMILQSPQWIAYTAYEGGQYQVSLDDFSMRRDGSTGYILDYYGDVNVEINTYHDEVSIYLMDGNRQEIAVFREE